MGSQSHLTLLLGLQEKLDDVTRDEELSLAFSRSKYASIRDALYERRKEIVMDIQYFWLRALINHPAFGLLITEWDARILAYLVDVDVQPIAGGRHVNDFEVVFSFTKNPYFEDRSLIKRYSYSDLNGRSVGVHRIKWKKEKGDARVEHNSEGRRYSGLFWWISQDHTDAADLGEIIRRQVFPNAIELYIGTFSVGSRLLPEPGIPRTH